MNDDAPAGVVRMSDADRDQLPEYSCSLPTATTIGKRWRRRSNGAWWLGEYYDIGDPKRVGIRWAKILPIEDDDGS